RRSKFETQLLIQSWRVLWEDIETLKGNPASMSTMTAGKSSGNVGSSMPSVGTGGGQIFSDIGLYRGTVVSIKHVRKQHITLNRNVLLEFNEIKDVVHENLNVFVGACVDPPNISLLWHYCPKGSLTDLLMNDDVKLDNTFKFSFMTDIAKGMEYLHKSHVHSHGNLKSSNCVVDSRWTVKVTDYGLPSFLAGQDNQDNESDIYKKKLWTAPEILRENFPNPRGSQKGDIYSFAIICFEIVTRSEPYVFDTITPRDVVNRVRNGESIPYRPALPDSADIGKPIIQLIKSCWDENIDNRLMFPNIRMSIKKHTGEINIADNVLKMMEKYAANLEEIVDERTQQMLEEKQKTDRLLFRMLPSSVAEQLKAGKFVQPENYEESTIYFSDIVGFASLASDSNPMQIVDFLNDLYSCFDDIIATHDVYKVETIGDAYMVVSGVPNINGNRHAAEIANVSLDLLSAVTHFRIRHRPHQQLKLRIGLHSGPVVAGVVGLIMPRYCLFGDTVNMAARMESSGEPLRVHISKSTYIYLTELNLGYEMTLRGEMNVKGKGLQTTYWLHGKKGFDKPLPAFNK
ncbi:hypothetical protein CAPTEDRAFT_133767, partial [Capitella teleta]